MSRHNFLAGMVPILLCTSTLLGQPQPNNLNLPVNTSSTSVSHLFVGEQVAFFDAKDEPTLWNGFEAYRYFTVIDQTLGIGEALPIQDALTPFPVQNYPNIVLGGGYLDETGENAHAIRVVDHYFGVMYNGSIFGNGLWGWVPVPLTAAVVTAGITGRDVGGDETSRYSVLGYDFTHGGTPDHYLVYRTLVEVEPGQFVEAYVPIPRGAMPTGLAIYDIGFREEALPNQLHDMIVAATEDVNVEPPVPPLIEGYVVTEALYWTGQMTEQNPLWTRVDLGIDEIRNMQICLRNHQLRAVALNGASNEFVAYRGVFNFNELVLWEPIVIASNLPDGSIPYDLEILELAPEVLVMMTATSKGLFISTDDGQNWANAGISTNGLIRTPELRQVSVFRYDPHMVAVAGWFASYVGQADANWNFTWNEISFEPELYQHWNRASSAVRAGPATTARNIVLIDHASDPIFPDSKPVVIQIQAAFGTAPSRKTVELGKQDEHEGDTHAWLRLSKGTGVPWIVYDREVADGPMVRTGVAPEFLEWNSTALFNDPNGIKAPVSDISTSPAGDFIMFDRSAAMDGHVNQLWRKRTGGWERAHCVGLEGDMLQGYLATGTSALFALFPVANNRFLYQSADLGDNFSLITALPADWSASVYNTISMGFDDDMPLYVGGKVLQNGDGKIHRRSPAGPLWTSLTLSAAGYGEVRDVVADPYEPNTCWVYTRTSSGAPKLSCVYLSEMPPYGLASWWKPQTHIPEYDIKDIQLVPTSITHRVLDLTLKTPDSNDEDVDHTVVKRWEFDVFVPGEPLLSPISGTWLLNSDYTILATELLTIEPGTTIWCAPGAKLIVKGSLDVQGGVGNEVVFQRVAVDQTAPWDGIEIKGIANLSNCKVSGATTGISLISATGQVALTGCEIFDNGVGLYVYGNPNNQIETVTSCTIHNNTQQGVSLLASKFLTLTSNEITANGLGGVLATNAQATLNENNIHHNGEANGGYGLECYGSSPVLYCNDFENNDKGEIGLYNQSYPVLWSVTTAGAGVNSFLNDTKSLVSMWDSYPIVKNGHNNFTVGSTGYFMADMSVSPKKRDISGNYWNPTLSLSKLYPSSSSVYTWTSTDGVPNSCGAGMSGGGSGPEAMFMQGFSAENDGDLAEAQSFYSSAITQYPDSEWASAAAGRLFNTQCAIDSGFGSLQEFMNDVAAIENEPELTKTAETFATRLWVEDSQYDPALTTYEEIMFDAPSEVDSAYAALDYTITALRWQYDSTRGGLDSERPIVAMSSIAELTRHMESVAPPVPQAHHEGYVVVPHDFVLYQNYPNPFNPITEIRFDLPENGQVELAIFNTLGQKVATVIDEMKVAGSHIVRWDGTRMASGVYLYRLKAGSFVESKKMILMR